MNYSIRKSSPVLLAKKNRPIHHSVRLNWPNSRKEWLRLTPHQVPLSLLYNPLSIISRALRFLFAEPSSFFGDASVRSSDTVGTRSAEIANDWSPWISKDNLAQCAFVFIGFRSDVVKHTKHAINHVNVRCLLVYQLWWMI